MFGREKKQILDGKLKMCKGTSCPQQIHKLFKMTAIENEITRRTSFGWEWGLYAIFWQLLIINYSEFIKKKIEVEGSKEAHRSKGKPEVSAP